MRCLICSNLEAAFEARHSEYLEAGSGAFYGVSKRFAAYINVEMERARIELEEHRLVCLSAANETALRLLAAPSPLAHNEELRSGPVQTAA